MSISINEKEKNFIRLAEARTNKAIDCIELIGNLSNKTYYEYSQKQIDSIFNAIQSALTAQKRKFNNTSKKTKFKL